MDFGLTPFSLNSYMILAGYYTSESILSFIELVTNKHLSIYHLNLE